MRDRITVEDLPGLFLGAAELFAEKQEELCRMDARLGDGDLGLTMKKGYGALPQLLKESEADSDIGKTLVRAGMKMAGVVPSTMGTLMASGLMEGGKALSGKTEMGAKEMADFLVGFAAGIMRRGKCAPGDRTVLDAMDAAAKAAAGAVKEGSSLAETVSAAVEGAKAGTERTRDMVPKFGKAAVHAAEAAGTPDQGAVAGLYLLMGLERFFEE